MSYYPVNTTDNNTPSQPADLIVNQLINLLLGPATVIPNGKNNILQSNSNGLILNKEDFNAYVTNTQNSNPPSTVPKAYLNYVLFDDNFKMVTGGVVRVSQPDVITPLTSSMSVNKNGYLYVYVSNESPTDVYFDDLVVKHATGHLLQEDSYYPFGLQIRALSSIALNRMQNDYLYNGIEKISDFDLEIYDALYRNLDAQIGRWWQMDPLLENAMGFSPYCSNFNNPVNFTDPQGDWPIIDGFGIYDMITQGMGTILQRVDVVAPKILGAAMSEGSLRFTTSSFTLLGKLRSAQAARRQAEFTRIAIDFQKVYPGRLPQQPYVSSSLELYNPTWVDNWSESNNFVAEGTYEIADGSWVTLQSFNPFGRPSHIAHLNGSTINGNERMKAFVNVTNTVVSNYVGGQAFEAVVPLLGRLVSKAPLPSMDPTGKVHGALPRIGDLMKYSREELEVLLGELRQSVKRRIEVTSKMGRHRPHGQRQGDEQALIKAIEKLFEDTK